MASVKNRGQTQNLRRGKVAPNGQHRIQPGEALNPEGNIAAIEQARARDKQIAQMARDEPERVQEELYSELSLAALRLTRKLNRSGGEPTRALVDAWREVRQAGLVVLDIRRTRGALAEAEELFASLSSRLEELAPRLAASADPIATDADGPSDVLDAAGDV